MFCLVQIDQAAQVGSADFGDRVYDFDFAAYSYGASRPSRFVVSNLRRDGRSAVNPSRGAVIEDAVRRAWVA